MGYANGFIKSVECCCSNALIINGLVTRIKRHQHYWDFGFAKISWPNNLLNTDLMGVLVQQCYGIIEPKNKDVIDVGAFIGDSAMYFAMRGAKRVIAIEPHPGAYEEMLETHKAKQHGRQNNTN
jgi:hypothetical protein